MILKKLGLKNFRNYINLTSEFNPALNIIYGKNAQGKTNLLESIYYLSFVSSFRTKDDKKLVNWNKNFFKIEGNVERKGNEYGVEILYSKEGKKKLTVNRSIINKIVNYIGTVKTVLFIPDDILVIKGGPAYRRRYIDRQIFQIYPHYFSIYRNFKKILYQRNMLLKQIKKGNAGKGQLEIWDPQYANLCSQILRRRLDVLHKLKKIAHIYHKKITDNCEEIELGYKMSFFSLDENKIPTSSEILDFIKKLRTSEIEKGITLLGPHRDDIIIKLNSHILRDYGSQGQQRTAILSLKMAELKFIEMETGEYPILLLDDVMSELDVIRQNLLASTISQKVQTFITTTDKDLKDYIKSDYSSIEVTDGKVI